MAEEAKTSAPAKTSMEKIKSAGPKGCRIAKCKRPYRAKGYCNVHYREWRQGMHPKRRYKICTNEACRKPRAKGSLCEEHGRPAAPAAAAS